MKHTWVYFTAYCNHGSEAGWWIVNPKSEWLQKQRDLNDPNIEILDNEVGEVISDPFLATDNNVFHVAVRSQKLGFLSGEINYMKNRAIKGNQ